MAGSGQGNGAAPAAFSAISALVVNAYRRMGHGAKLTLSYTARLFLLAAIMYVDDTDLLHWADNPYVSDEEFILQCQKATTDWGLLAHATGGALKPAKCSIYFMLYKFVNGRAKLK